MQAQGQRVTNAAVYAMVHGNRTYFVSPCATIYTCTNEPFPVLRKMTTEWRVYDGRTRSSTHLPPGPTRNQCEYQRRFAQKHAEELQRLRQKLAQKIYHESKRHDWETPWPVFREYDAEFHCTLDVCATAANTKCARFSPPRTTVWCRTGVTTSAG